jgi:hypothetical protein
MIKRILKVFLACLAFSGVVAKAGNLGPPDVWGNYESTKNSLPKDASRTLDQAVNCSHLSGEMNGDKSQHDKEIIQSINNLHCGKVEANVIAIKNKYKSNAAVQKAFKIYYESE